MNVELFEAELKGKTYPGGAKLKEPTIEGVKTVCGVLGIRDVYSMMTNLEADLQLLAKFEGDRRKQERFLEACLNGVTEEAFKQEGAFFLEVKNDFFTWFMLRSGLLNYLVRNMSERLSV